jgi:hypothetical protein
VRPKLAASLRLSPSLSKLRIRFIEDRGVCSSARQSVDSELASAGLSSLASVEYRFLGALVRRAPRRALRERQGRIRGDSGGAFGRSA